MKSRAAAVLVEDGRAAMIERRRQGRLFYVFPGGHVEPGELPEEAVVREVKEELGLDVTVARLLAESTYAGRLHRYYLVELKGGEFGSGSGAELARSADSERGSVRPAWLDVAEFERQVVFPQRMADLVSQSLVSGWPVEILNFIEPEEPLK